MHLEKRSHSPTWYRFPPIIPRRNLFVMAQLDVVIANNTHFHLAFSCTIATLRSTWNKHCTYWSREREKYDASKHVPSSMFHFFSNAVCKLSITFVQTVKILIYTLSNRFAQNVSILPIATAKTLQIYHSTQFHIQLDCAVVVHNQNLEFSIKLSFHQFHGNMKQTRFMWKANQLLKMNGKIKSYRKNVDVETFFCIMFQLFCIF